MNDFIFFIDQNPGKGKVFKDYFFSDMLDVYVHRHLLFDIVIQFRPAVKMQSRMIHSPFDKSMFTLKDFPFSVNGMEKVGELADALGSS